MVHKMGCLPEPVPAQAGAGMTPISLDNFAQNYQQNSVIPAKAGIPSSSFFAIIHLLG